MQQKLLIVDDEQGIVDIMESYFTTEYEILTACNGQEAVRKAQEQPDLILLDINDTANDWLDRMIPQMAKAAGATEELKARDQMAWVGLMNNCKARVEEIIFAELVMI